MAKINVLIDTDENSMDVTVNGKSVDNVQHVSCCARTEEDMKYGAAMCYIYTAVEDEDGVQISTTMRAHQNDSAVVIRPIADMEVIENLAKTRVSLAINKRHDAFDKKLMEFVSKGISK